MTKGIVLKFISMHYTLYKFKFSFYCCRTEDAENEPAKTKDIVAESIDKCDNIFMIQGDDYYDQLEKKLSR